MQFVKEVFRRGSSPARTVDFFIIPALILLVLVLPPVSITTKKSSGEGPKIVSASTDVKVELLSGGGPSTADVRSSVDDSAKPPMGDGLSAVSPHYRFEIPTGVTSAARITIPLQVSVSTNDTIDVYSLGESGWSWQGTATPSTDGSTAVAEIRSVPGNLIVAKTSVSNPSVAVSLARNSNIDDTTKENIATINPDWHTVKSDGSLAGPMGELPKGKFNVIPAVSNKNTSSYDGKALDAIFASDATRKAHVNNIVSLANQNYYGGIEIDYQALNSGAKDKFSAFVTELSTELHKNNRKLSVIVPTPTKNDSGWDTGAYDLFAIGASADYVKVRPVASRATYYKDTPEVLSYVTGQVDRRKVQLVLSTSSQDSGPAETKSIAYRDALNLSTKIEIKQPASIAPGKTLTFLAVNLLADTGGSGLKWDDNAKAVAFNYKGTDGNHTVYIENAFSAGYRLQLAKQYNINGVALEPAGQHLAESKISDMLKGFTGGSVQLLEPNTSAFSPVWEASEGAVESTSGAWTNWTIPNGEGDFQVNVSISDGVIRVNGSKSVSTMPVVVAAAKPTSTPGPTQSAPPTPTRVPPTPATATGPAPATGRYPGVSYGMCIDIGNDMNRSLALTKQAGFGWAKVQLRWESLESSKGNINWGLIDDVVNRTSAAGVRLIVSVVTAPSWSRPGNTDWGVPGPPANPQDFADFVGAIAARHTGKVHAYEIWNEQNLWYEWGGRGRRLNAGQYVDLLKASYIKLKATDPSAVVVSGALTPTGFNDGDTAYDDVQFMQMMYAAGMKNYCDAVGVHANVVQPFAAELPPGQANHPSFYFRRFEQIREIMVQYGDGNKQIWFTEFGWPSSSNPHPDYPNAREISEENQAAWLVKGFEIAKQKGYIGLMAVWNLNYAPIAEADDRYAKKAFSIINPDWSPRPAFSRLATMPK